MYFSLVRFLDQAVTAQLAPQYLGDMLAIMFESRYLFDPTAYALESPTLDRGYDAAWAGFRKAQVDR